MLTMSETFAAIAEALAIAQGQMDNAMKGRENPAFRSKYADLASVRDAVVGPLSAAGIAMLQAPSVDEHGVHVETRLIHKSGEWLACHLSAVPKDFGPQAIGSAVTYLRRYSLMSMVGIAPEDDDGNGAGAPTHDRPPGASREAPSQGETPPVCPTCGGAMWDNRATKTNPKQPDFKCKNKGCEGVIWPPKAGSPVATDYAARFRSYWHARLSACGRRLSDDDRHAVQAALFGHAHLAEMSDDERAECGRKLRDTLDEALAVIIDKILEDARARPAADEEVPF